MTGHQPTPGVDYDIIGNPTATQDIQEVISALAGTGRVPLVEWVRIDEALRAAVRQRELQSVTPKRSFEESVQPLLETGVTNQAEFRRLFGL
jgi:TPP-dependent indolepyruvate ferredoxin oxidoreductase alpha subunit